VTDVSGRQCALLLATENPDKRRKLAWLVDGLGFSLIDHTAAVGAQREPSDSHRGAAEHKALWWSRNTTALVLASDGGVEIPALGTQWKSTLTRRESGAATDHGRTRDLLERMGDLQGENRSAYWIEAVALAACGHLVGAWEERGPRLLVATAPSGMRAEGGFWLETLLAEPGSGRTLADLSPRELRAIDRPWRVLRVCVRRRLIAWKSEHDGRVSHIPV
jgi:inosine/xanthosine triphosphate pyrophosphatase family protein